jgi:23S rRNA (uridine2552-2'-O)-methyltransferase|tara:strand:+ start:189 stop:800 length:612 start_codon:yes stop_codon:yes gene_type:complete
LKKNKISKSWVIRQRRDKYVRQSKLEGYRSRAVYKLKELDEKFKIVKNNLSILDIGSAPGSWTQYLSEKSKGSKIMSIDLKEVEKIKDVYHVVGDFLDNENQKIITDYFPKKIDLVVSDMAVNTTGNKNLDSIQTGELSLTAMHYAVDMLRPKGIFLSKIFMGSTFNEIVENAKKNFKESKIFKPPSSRKDSKESFIICKNLR